MTPATRARVEVPLYTIADAARIVSAPASTLAGWAKGYVRRAEAVSADAVAPVITCFQAPRPYEPAIPFVGLAEALVLAAFRRSAAPLRRVWPALAHLQGEIGIDHALA